MKGTNMMMFTKRTLFTKRTMFTKRPYFPLALPLTFPPTTRPLSNHTTSSLASYTAKVNQLDLASLDSQSVIDIIKGYQGLLSKIHDHSKFWDNPENITINTEIQRLLLHPDITFDNQLLKLIFALRLPNWTNINIITSFYEKNPKGVIDKSVALIPFRYCLFDGDLTSALKITDMTTGHPNYIAAKKNQFRSGIMKLVGSSVGITLFSKYGVYELIELGVLSPRYGFLSSVNTLVLTYLINSTFLVSMVRFGRQLVASGGDYLRWQKGTFYTHWFTHGDEMLMCSKIVEADIAMTGGGISGGEVSPELIDELCRKPQHEEVLKPGYNRDGAKVRLLDVKDNLEDLKLQAYWMSGGDGFEWVEPDQDPAEIIWKRNLQSYGELGDDNTKSLKWAESLIEDGKRSE